MNATVLSGALRTTSLADAALKGSAQLWFLVAFVGQWLLVFYVVAFYGGTALQGNLPAWNKVLPTGYVSGDTVGNLALMIHIFIAATLTAAGTLQLIPQIRTYAPTFHRWNGRVFVVTAFITSIAGLYMVWFRPALGDWTQHVAISINAVLIMVFAALALRYAMARDMRTHRRWALRLFLVVNGVWFFRVMLMFWVAVNGGPVGFDPKSFSGPAITIIAFGQFVLPLAVLELYLRAQERGSAVRKAAVAGALVVLTGAMGVGIAVAAMGMWLPRIMG